VFEFRIRVNECVGRASEKGEDLKAEGSLLNIRTGLVGISLVESVCVSERLSPSKQRTLRPISLSTSLATSATLRFPSSPEEEAKGGLRE